MNKQIVHKSLTKILTYNLYTNSEYTEICYGQENTKTGEIQYDMHAVLLILLLDNQVYMEDNLAENDWPAEARSTVSLKVDCSDVFAWGYGDDETVEYSELIDLFKHYDRDSNDGAAIWCIKKRKMMPQQPFYDVIMNGNKWDLTLMDLEPNPSWN